MKEQKTNVMRLLEQKKIKYTPHEYPHGDDAVDGATVAAICGLDPSQVFKTLVARGASKSIYVFDVPVTGELDLKKAAKAAGESNDPRQRDQCAHGLYPRRLLANWHEKAIQDLYRHKRAE